jgi:hypothetical protein
MTDVNYEDGKILRKAEEFVMYTTQHNTSISNLYSTHSYKKAFTSGFLL